MCQGHSVAYRPSGAIFASDSLRQHADSYNIQDVVTQLQRMAENNIAH